MSWRTRTRDAAAPSSLDAPIEIDDRLVGLLRYPSIELDQYKALRYALEESDGEKRPGIVAVTSPAVGDGKTTTAINLAGVLARRRDSRILLVDADLRRPSIAARLNLMHDARQAGFADAIADPDLTLDHVVTPVPAVNLSILPAWRPADDAFELLRAPRAAELLDEARRRYDFVVLDTPPLLLFPDSRILENRVDTFLLVVAAHRTPRKLVEDALNVLNPSRLMGIVFNGDDSYRSKYGASYYGYGEGSRSGFSAVRAQWR